jgi:hypothetical protein
MDDWNLPWEGGCRCGRVRVRVTAPPLVTMVCHCTGCQRMSASAFSLSIAIPSPGFAVTQGEPVIGGLHGEARHHFCPWCMSWMFTRIAGLDDFVNLRAPVLDDARWIEPFVETFTAEKLPWASTPAPHSYAGFPPEADYPRLLAAFAERGPRPPAAATA